jgi:hypothetical protein
MSEVWKCSKCGALADLDKCRIEVHGRQVIVVIDAPRRFDVNKDGEIRYLRFAIINRKVSAHVAQIDP